MTTSSPSLKWLRSWQAWYEGFGADMPGDALLSAAKFRLAADELEQALRNYADEKTIVDRIWDMFGRPDYQELAGRSIYDLIQATIDANAKRSTDLERVTKERDALQERYSDMLMCVGEDRLLAENAALHEQLAALKSPEVCYAAHDNVETCGYCQRDAALRRLEPCREAFQAIAEEGWMFCGPEGPSEAQKKVIVAWEALRVVEERVPSQCQVNDWCVHPDGHGGPCQSMADQLAANSYGRELDEADRVVEKQLPVGVKPTFDYE